MIGFAGIAIPKKFYATLSQNGEYRVDVALPDDLVDAWTRVRVTDPMPFRFILLPFPDAA